MTASNNLLFSWADVEQRLELQRLKLVLDAMPNGDSLDAHEERRGHGRDDDPMAEMWRAMQAGIVFQHESAQSLLRELQRYPALLALCGFPALPRQSAPKRVVSEADGSTVIYLPQPLRDPAPDACNFSRFLRAVMELEEEQGMIAAMIRTMREQLMEEADDFGEFLGYDGKAMESHSTGASNRVTGKTSDADADWGKHETHGIHAKTGKPWKKIKSWFGYRVHTIADTQTEIPVAASVTRASVSEVKELERLSERLFEETPALAERCKEFSADRGLDRGPLKATLWDRHRIRPLIDSRALWSAEKKQAGYDPAKPISRPLFRARNRTVQTDLLLAKDSEKQHPDASALPEGSKRSMPTPPATPRKAARTKKLATAQTPLQEDCRKQRRRESRPLRQHCDKKTDCALAFHNSQEMAFSSQNRQALCGCSG